MKPTYSNLKELSPKQLRSTIREESYTGQTAGLCKGYQQANLVVLPEEYASDFLDYCQKNPKACPLLAVSELGSPNLPTLGVDIDVRSDLPAYFTYVEGAFVSETNDVSDQWRGDFVAFAIGCSFSFEHALITAGFKLHHVTHNATVPMYRTNIQTTAAGPFEGGMVVSMRAIPSSRLEELREISERFPHAHGGPVHVGDPQELGIQDISQPDWGDAITFEATEIPVFWACGVTPQVALDTARPSICITHKPGHMLVTDLTDSQSIQVSPKYVPRAAAH